MRLHSFESSQDGKTAEELASVDHHEHIVSLLVRLKKVKRHTRPHTDIRSHTSV